MSPPRNKAGELRAALAKNPTAERDVLCELLDVDPYELSRMRSRLKRNPSAGTGPARSPKPAPSLPVLGIGSAMGIGPGVRREDCAHYRGCLGDLARRTNKEGHCPQRCTRFEASDRGAELQARARSGLAVA